MSAALDNIQAQINLLQSEKDIAEEEYKKYNSVIKRVDALLYHKTWFTDKSILHRLEYISDHYIGRNGVYDRMERNPESAEGKFMQLFISREQENREACTNNLTEIQERYGEIVKQRNYAVVLRDECQQTITAKEQAIQEQKQAYKAQEERERREREEQARRAAEEAARQEAARIAAEQQKAAQEAAERQAAQRTASTGRSRRR